MSAKSLAHAMRDVSLRGPNDLNTWTRLVGRADMIAHSFNPKQAALVVHSLGKVFEKKTFSQTDFIQSFISRFNRKFLPEIVPHTTALDAAQIIHGLSVLEKTNKRLIESLPVLMNRVSSLAPHMDMKSVSMCAAGLSNDKIVVPNQIRTNCIVALSQRFLQLEDVNEQSFAQIMRACSTLGPDEEIRKLVDEICVKCIMMFQTMSVRSLSVALNSLGKMGNCTRPIVNEILMIVSERVLRGESSFSSGASLLQLAVILRSLQKLGINDVSPLVDHALVKYIRTRDLETLSAHTVCVLLSALSHVPDTGEIVMAVIDGSLNKGLRFSPNEILIVTNALKRTGVDPDYIHGEAYNLKGEKRDANVGLRESSM